MLGRNCIRIVSGNYYRPLFLLWFRLNHAMFGLDPKGWHLTTILCHVAATYLVFGLVRRLAANHWIAFSAATSSPFTPFTSKASPGYQALPIR